MGKESQYKTNNTQTKLRGEINKMETKKLRDFIRNKLDVIDEGDINLEGESKDHIEGFRQGLGFVIDEFLDELNSNY